MAIGRAPACILPLLALLFLTACGATPPHCSSSPEGVVGENCPARELGQRLGRDRLLIGGRMTDDSFATAPFDLRYAYLLGPVPDSPCVSCADGCQADGSSCANDAGGCGWWGCWQWDGLPPGRYPADFVQSVESAGAVPMFTYYVWLSVAGGIEGAEEIAALQDPARLTRYLADWRLFCQTVQAAATGPVIAHLEPDLWGFGHKVSPDPDAIPVAVGAANAPECSHLPDTLAGLGRCMLAIARANAPGLLVGFHASAWGAGQDIHLSDDPRLDVAWHAQQTASFLIALGAAEADLVVVEMSDRDTGAGGNSWDAGNRRFPNFDRSIAWAAYLSIALDLAPLWWQIPYGHPGLENRCSRFEDNRVDYLFGHPDQVAAGGAIGFAFGAGTECMTTAETDGGHFLQQAQAYLANERPCLCGVCR
ncbi:MAG: hypothetical protein JW797_18635 [Bradymonadales bacterium]|nr:hypothetical protein [Bradymonadales bacterium]